jgi:hypothetical protein
MNIDEMMAQAKNLQERVATAQNDLANVRVKGLAANGACIIEMTGKYDIVDVIISDDAMKNSASELSKIVRDAFLDAKSKADTIIDKTMSEATAGVNLPF